MTPGYPLAPLETLRDARLSEREHALAAALRELQAAQAELTVAEGQLALAREEGQTARGAEATLLAAGALRALDLAQQAAHAQHELERDRALQARVDDAAQRVSSALSAEAAARDALARARGDQQSVVEHRKVWQAARDRKDEQQAEEAATELWNARLKGSGPA